MEKNQKPKIALISFFSNPLVGIIGSIASVIGLLLAIYFYLGSKESRQLTYYVHPAKAAVLKMGQASKLSVKYDNKDLQSDVTAVQIAFWNAGKLPVRKTNVLKPFMIQLQNNTPILEVSVRKISRDVTNILIDQKDIQKGLLTVNWEILEQNDGAVIQIIYSGGPDLGIGANGTIEGQKNVKQLEYSGKIMSPEEQYGSFIKERKFIGFAFTLTGIIALVGGFVFVTLRKKNR